MSNTIRELIVDVKTGEKNVITRELTTEEMAAEVIEEEQT